MRATVCFLAAITSSQAASADAPADLKLTQKVQLLGGRLEAALPAAMKLEARGHSIMAAEASGEDETRAVIDLGKARFVMMTYEYFALTGTDLKAAIAAEKKAQGEPTDTVKLEPLAVAKPLTAIADILPATKGDAEANLIYAAWIGNSDSTVQLLAFYINPDGAKAATSWAQLARNIALTLKPGKRTLDTKAAAHKLGEGKEAMTITTPDGWAASTQPGPDFTVYRLRKLANLGAPAASCGIYLGNHGSYQYTQQDIDKAKVKPTPGKLFKTAVTWQTWTASGRSTTEAMAKHPSGSATVHAFCSAGTEAELADLRKMIETIQ